MDLTSMRLTYASLRSAEDGLLSLLARILLGTQAHPLLTNSAAADLSKHSTPSGQVERASPTFIERVLTVAPPPLTAATRPRITIAQPLALFSSWFDDAVAAGRAAIPEPNAVAVSTCSAAGQPSVRIVLMKKFDSHGFRFATSYHSAKAADISANERVALLFYWAPMNRQVRIEGIARRCDAIESDSFFNNRPRGNQIGSLSSEFQSRPVPDREFLRKRFEDLYVQYEGKEVVRPEWWGGYLVRPERIEFWQGVESRLHDRIRFFRLEGANSQPESSPESASSSVGAQTGAQQSASSGSSSTPAIKEAESEEQAEWSVEILSP